MAFAKRLRDFRKEKGMTQAQLAEAIGVTTRTVTNYEAERSYPNMDVISRLETLFNARIDLFMDSREEFISQARERYGYRGKRGAERLVAEVGGLFAGGDLTEIDKDAVMKALQDAYWDAKSRNKKYTPKKYRK
jgi:transcriptional regulator with XRE-family HTH domain